MFTLLHPAALWALLGLAVPVAIHLFNRRPGREVAVGSLRWLAAGANRRLRRLRPEQLALLALRALLLAALAGAAAGPSWRKARPAGRGQVLLSPAVAGTPALAALRPALDSLRRRGYALRWLAPGFARVAADSTAFGVTGDAAKRLSGPPAEAWLWARVQQAAGEFAGQPLHVLTSDRLAAFGGAHPPLPANLTWQLLPTPETAEWLQAATADADSLRLQIGRSDAAQTTFRTVAVRRLAAAGGLVRVGPGLSWRYELAADGRARLRPSGAANAAAPPVDVQTQPLRVAILTGPGYAADARCLRAALRAAALGLAQPLLLTAANDLPPTAPAADAPAPDWLFWLSDQALPAGWRAAAQTRGVRIWQEAAGPGRADRAQLADAVGWPAGPPVAVAVYRRGPAAGPGSAALWTDGQGRPVLSRQALGRGAAYRLHTRLLPAWSTLADSPALPALLLELLRAEPETVPLDQRRLDPAQLPPPPLAAPATNQSPPAGPFELTDLRPWLVLAAGLLFGLERWLAGRRARSNLPATP